MSKRPCSTSTDLSPAAKRQSTAHSFPVFPSHRYSGKCPEYKQPVEIQSYSIDANRRVWFDQRELKYYIEPKLSSPGPCLSRGYDRFIKRDESVPEHLDTLLDTLTTARLNGSPDVDHVDIVTWRGIMTKIFCTPFTRNEPWELRATRYKNTIFMEEQATEQKLRQEQTMSERQRLMSYWGYSFESMCTATEPKGVPDPDDVPNTNVQYCVAVKTRLGRNTIAMGAEVDCIEGEKPKDGNLLRQYVELKTSRRMDTQRQKENFERFKLLKFWAQSFLIGVPKVICGFRDDDGVLSHLETFKTLEIPRKVRHGTGAWDASACMNFANEFLDWLKKVVTEDDPTVTYSITWNAPWREIRVSRAGHVNVFLTQRYLDGETSHDIGGPRAQQGSSSN
ncbi:hypothetical protein O0I10_000932 [Lichtheimia ornata]|uniref:Decapping nuclease n=1 Tax=Lichtheimia ornata TaxID=688661 RepID=A0AAD7Y4J9_9FUNG|nr:uncharacterized protein O0I10_000932 [Lichtheimia ornata]KAJ8663683.1 hypothetical protein O0I10_000932 [Lichtheimia ornata]